jgi:hypothetical protein
LTEERRSGDGMLGKGLRLLVALGDHPEGAGVSQLARDVEVPVSTAHRLLAGMVPLATCATRSSPRSTRVPTRYSAKSSPGNFSDDW